MSLALMAFSNWNNGLASQAQPAGTQGAGQSGATSAGTGSTAQITQGGTASVSQLVTDLQSLLSTLTGTSTPPTVMSAPSTGSTNASDTSDASTNIGTAAATGLSDPLSQDLKAVQSDIHGLEPASTAVQPGGPGGPPPGMPWQDSIPDTGTKGGAGTDGPGGWNPGYSDSFQQQFAFSAYASSVASGANSSTTPLLANLTV
jgi:hypothetical protein